MLNISYNSTGISDSHKHSSNGVYKMFVTHTSYLGLRSIRFGCGGVFLHAVGGKCKKEKLRENFKKKKRIKKEK